MRGSGWVNIKYIDYYEQLTSCTWLTYLTRPMHFFGSLGMLSGGCGSLVLGFLIFKKTQGIHIMVEHGPLMIAGALLLLTGVQLFCTGLLGEMLMRTYFESQNRPIYGAKEIIGSRKTRSE